MRKRWFLVFGAVLVAIMELWLFYTGDFNLGRSHTVAAAPLEVGDRPGSFPMAPVKVTAGRWVTACVDCPAAATLSLRGELQSLSLAIDSRDLPHVAYYQGDWGAGHLGYIYLNEAGRHVEIVDTTMTGYPYPGISLALDANDNPHISYYSYDADTYEGELRYAYRDDRGWHIELIGDEGTMTSLVLDENGIPHISYQTMIGELMYARRDASGWFTQTVHVRSGSSPNPTALALDGNGTPHIGYIAGAMVRYAYREASDWYSQTLARGDDLSLALANNDSVHIGYASEGDLAYVSYQDASGWHTQTLDREGDVGDYPSLALDEATGYAHISYYDDSCRCLKYAHEEASGWLTQTLDRYDEVGEHTSLALDSAGYAHIVYYDASLEQLKYAYQNADGWHTQNGLYTSLALDVQGDAHISYYDWSKGDLNYAYRTSSGWHRQTVDSNGNVGLYTSLALDGNGYPHISYYDATHKDLNYAYQDAEGWYTHTVDSEGDVGRYTSLALEATAPYTAHISYYDATTQQPKYAHQEARGWYSQTVGQGAQGGQYTSLALDPDGTPHISYCEYHYVRSAEQYDGDLIYIEQTGPTTWSRSTVDHYGTLIRVVGRFSALALDAEGGAHISYYDDDTSYLMDVNGALRYAYGYASFSDGWPSREIVDAESVGRYTSLALDVEDYPHISYYDWLSGSLKYAYQDASGWYSQTVEQAGDVGRYTSLAMDRYDHAHISYYDAQQADLKYAYYTTRTLPSVPILLYPPTGTVTTSHAVTLRWHAGAGPSPDGYNVQLDDEVVTTTETTSPTVLALGVHTWTVRAYNAEGYSAWAAPWTVEVTETAPTLPSTPTLLHPQDGTVTTTQAITLRWQAGVGPDPIGYHVRLDGETVTTTAPASPTLLALGVHTWTVRAYTEGHSDWASPWKVTVTENIYAVHLPLVLRNH